MIIRNALLPDIERMHEIRLRVRENALSNPLVVQEKDYVPFLTGINKGWVAEIENKVIGFAIIDVERSNIWALFVDPESEGRGAGKKLQEEMLNWYFENHSNELWLSTAPATRAERFYTASGWRNCGLLPNGEVKFTRTCR